MAAPPAAAAGQAPDAAAAGELLRAARQQQGLHIAALAASIKVPPAKLEALEAGRLQELPDATFARALAQAVCRALKTDPAPVLALLPGTPPDALGRVDGGLNTPFREHPGRMLPADLAGLAPWRRPVLWLVALLLVAAAAFVLVPGSPPVVEVLPAGDAGTPPPAGLPDAGQPTAPGASAATAGEVPTPLAASAPAASPPAVAAASAPAVPAPAASVAFAPVAGDTLVLRATEASWVQAIDGNGQTLMARLVPAGETVSLTPVLPVRLRIGNARGTELQFRGQPVVLSTRDNIANLTLP